MIETGEKGKSIGEEIYVYVVKDKCRKRRTNYMKNDSNVCT